MTSPLIKSAELRDVLGAVTLVDVRYRTGGPPGEPEYAAGHLPGAAFVDLDQALAEAPGAGGRHPLPDPAVFEAAMRRAGVSNDRPVVAYDDWSGHAAGRAWWLLRYHGHPDVRVLDGGLSAWVADGGEIESGAADVEPGDFTVSTEKGLPLVEADRVLEVPVLVDARAPERFRGEVEPIDPVAGRIPGAVNVPTSTNLRADGTYRSADELRALYAAAGVTGDAEVAAYCGSGVTAIHDIIAMEIAGIRAALYPGSWSGWITEPDRQVETGGGMVLRGSAVTDVPALVALAEAVWPAAYDFDPDYAAYTIATWWTAESTAASLERTDWVVAERGGRLVGAGNLDLGQLVPTVWKLLVHPDEQGCGTGTRILRALAQRAGDRGLQLSYVAGNRSAEGFYTRLGFREVGREPANNDQPEHVVVMWSPADGGPLVG